MNLNDVMYGEWRIDDQGRVVLGESKFLMRFDVDGSGQLFYYAGRPDLPVAMGDRRFVFDHKTTNAYLSDYWFDQHRHSNQLRCYARMLEVLLGSRVHGALINGIYVGTKAASTEFSGSKFARFGPLLFQPGQLDEAIRNQFYWERIYREYDLSGYWPQHTGRSCTGCTFTAGDRVKKVSGKHQLSFTCINL